MNYERISELYSFLAEESKKTPLNQERIDEINHYLAIELGMKPPKLATGSFWTRLRTAIFPLPADWKIYVTSIIGAFIAVNSQLHLVPQNIQDAFLAAAVSLGFWAVNSTQTINLAKLKAHLTMLQNRK